MVAYKLRLIKQIQHTLEFTNVVFIINIIELKKIQCHSHTLYVCTSLLELLFNFNLRNIGVILIL